jgi:hypothetical protein
MIMNEPLDFSELVSREYAEISQELVATAATPDEEFLAEDLAYAIALDNVAATSK